MRRMTQSQYSAIIARQRHLQKQNMPTQNELMTNNTLNGNQNNRNTNALIAINELNQKVAERENEMKK